MRMSRALLAGWCVASALAAAAPAWAQAPASAPASSSSAPAVQIDAVISGPQDIGVGRTIILDASLSRTGDGPVRYEWYVGEGMQPISRSVEAVYTPDRPGAQTFRLIIVSGEGESAVRGEAAHVVTVYTRKFVIIADGSVPQEKLDIHGREAAATGAFLRVVRADEAATPLGAEEGLAAVLRDQKDSLLGADTIVVWTQGVTGLQALMRVAQGDADVLAAMRDKTVVVVTDRSLALLARSVAAPFSILRPEQILVTRQEAIPRAFATKTTEALLADLALRDIDVRTVDESAIALRPWNVLTVLVNAMLGQGVPSQTVLLLLVLPVIATILAFLKQVVGITTFGLYTPSIIALSFLALGWQIGSVFLLFILFTGYATRALMRRWRLLYIPKVAIILTVVSITLLLLTAASASLGVSFSRETVFILLIMSTLSESFLNLKTEQGWKSALVGIGETILASFLCVSIVQWGAFQSLLLAYPELILLAFVFNAMLGRWTGLRLLEYVRFREVFKHLQAEE